MLGRKPALPAGVGAVVTGAGRGLGRALAMELGRRGARVVASDVDEAAAAETAAALRDAGITAHAVTCDVADADAVDALAEEARVLVGPVDVIVNNAGVAVAGRFERISLEDWRFAVDVNLWGVVHGCRAFVPPMLERGRGWVLNVASAAGLLSSPMMSPYNVTKAGVISLSETLFAEARPRGVKVSALCPTFFETGLMDAPRGAITEGVQRSVKDRMRRSSMQADDVARAGLDGLLRGKLHVVPMADGRAMWGIKRATPQRFYDLLERATSRRKRR